MAATAVAPRNATSATPTRGETTVNRQKVNDARAAFDKSVSHLSGLERMKKKFMKIMLCMLHNQLSLHPRTDRNHNIIVKGRPGTGKTTLVYALYEAMHAAGVLMGNFVKVKPNELTSGFDKVLQDAKDGMIFIDEAYELETRLKLNNDLNRAIDPRGGLPLFVVAGYPEKMEKWLRGDNPKGNMGLRSRFAHEVTIPDYSEYELMQIFDVKLQSCGSLGMPITPDSRPLLRKMARDIAENPQGNNGRDVEQIVGCIYDKWVIGGGIEDLSLRPHCDSKIVQEGIDDWLDDHPKHRSSTVSLDAVPSGALVHAATDSVAASASNYTIPTEVSKPLDPAVVEDVRRVLNGLCERADGAIVTLQQLSARLGDGDISKLGGIPDVARNPKSRSSTKRQFISTLKACLESIFEVRVNQNTTGRAVAGHSRFSGYYALNLRMRD